MPILCNRTFEVVTPESAEDGDFAAQGFSAEDEPFTFRELVNTLKHGTPSCWPARGETFEWVQYDTSTDFRTGAETSHNIHYSRNNPPRMARYWRLAFKFAGLIK